jgi:hypothetical protein
MEKKSKHHFESSSSFARKRKEENVKENKRVRECASMQKLTLLTKLSQFWFAKSLMARLDGETRRRLDYRLIL